MHILKIKQHVKHLTKKELEDIISHNYNSLFRIHYSITIYNSGELRNIINLLGHEQILKNYS